MIRYTTGNILVADVEALVNPVNTVGVMGKGLALEFKRIYPESFEVYREACRNNKVKIGEMFVYRRDPMDIPAWIIHFPTKEDWRNPSRLEWITTGLVALRNTMEAKNIRSIAIPALGCGLGGLAWEEVRREIEDVLGDVAADVWIYEPGGPTL